MPIIMTLVRPIHRKINCVDLRCCQTNWLWMIWRLSSSNRRKVHRRLWLDYSWSDSSHMRHDNSWLMSSLNIDRISLSSDLKKARRHHRVPTKVIGHCFHLVARAVLFMSFIDISIERVSHSSPWFMGGIQTKHIELWFFCGFSTATTTKAAPKRSKG